MPKDNRNWELVVGGAICIVIGLVGLTSAGTIDLGILLNAVGVSLFIIGVIGLSNKQQ